MPVAAAVTAPYTDEMLTAGQIRAGRAFLGWKQTDLAERSGVAEITIKKIEGGTNSRADTLEKLRAAFWKAGVGFVSPGEPSTDGGSGVRLHAVLPAQTEDGKP